jgi:tripartite-type tricarboxylate transporter receptor subunit TctC
MRGRVCGMREPLIVGCAEPIKPLHRMQSAAGGFMRWTRRTGLKFALIACAARPTLPAAAAADYPNRPIHVVVPFAAAGVTDIVARIVFEHIAQATGKTIVVDNRPGAGGTVAVGQIVNAAPDGYTLVMADPSGSLPANVTLYPDLKYDARRDLAPIAMFGTSGAMLVVGNGLPVKSVADLVALANSKPGELTFASTGIGTPGHLNGALFCRLAGIKAVHVPYRVVGQAVTDLIAGRISFWISPIATMLPQVRQGQVRALAVAGEERSPDLPGVPTIRETGLGDFDASTTYAMFAPVGTPRDALDWLRSQIKNALDDKDVVAKLSAAGVQPKYGSAEEIARMLQVRTPQWRDVIESAGIRLN